MSSALRKLRVMTMLDEVGRVGGGETIARWIATSLDQERFESWVCATRWHESQVLNRS